MNRTSRFGMLVAAAALTLAGCAGTSYNDADVAFAQDMIPHHQQAVQMAELAASRAASPAVVQLAATIEQAQAPEIDRMRGFLDAWGAPQPAASGMSAGMGMMSDASMQQLAQSSGPAFDRQFLQLMTAHHTGAIEMARTELASGQSADATALARTIIDAQQAEISRMQGLLQAAG